MCGRIEGCIINIKEEKQNIIVSEEVQNILDTMGLNKIDVQTELEVGMKVKVVGGPFNGMVGTVDTIDLDNSVVDLTIDLFGQDTQVEVELNQIQKAD